MSLGVHTDLQNRMADGDIDSQPRGASFQHTVEVRFARMGKPLGFEAFGLFESRNDQNEICGKLHFAFAVEGLTEDGEEPEAIGKEDVVEHPSELFVISGGRILLNGVQER